MVPHIIDLDSDQYKSLRTQCGPSDISEFSDAFIEVENNLQKNMQGSTKGYQKINCALDKKIKSKEAMGCRFGSYETVEPLTGESSDTVEEQEQHKRVTVMNEEGVIKEAKVEENKSEDQTAMQNTIEKATFESMGQIKGKGENDDQVTENEPKDKELTGKERGNLEFEKGNYMAAVEEWRNSLRSFRYVLSKNVYEGKDKQFLLDTEQMLNLNLSLGYMKLGKLVESIEYSDAVLSRDPNNQKALFRRASALFMLQEYTSALQSIDGLLRLDPNNTPARRLRLNIVDASRRYKLKERRVLRNMFRSIESDPRTKITGKRRIFNFFLNGWQLFTEVIRLPLDLLLQLWSISTSFCGRRRKPWNYIPFMRNHNESHVSCNYYESNYVNESCCTTFYKIASSFFRRVNSWHTKHA